MLELVQAGGWLMLPIILCSIIAIAIIIERFWTLNAARIAPQNILAQVWAWLKNDQLDSGKLQQLRLSSPLGQILAAGLLNSKYGRSAMVDSIEQASSQVIHEMERYLNTLGTLAGNATAGFAWHCCRDDSSIQRNHASRYGKCECAGRRDL